MSDKLNSIIITFFAVTASWIILAATPYFRLQGPLPQVDTQIIFLHGICAIFYFYQTLKFIFKKKEIEKLSHPLIILPFFLSILGIISSFFAKNLSTSLAGSSQIGQGVFWYLDITIMSLLFSQLATYKYIRIILFINTLLITLFVTFFTFFPMWRGIPISFYNFTDYLCFYGVINFIMLTTITRNYLAYLFSFILLGYYFQIIDNNSAMIAWVTTFLVGATYFLFISINKYLNVKKIIVLISSSYTYVFIIFFFTFMTLFSSLYFWQGDYRLPLEIQHTFLEPIVVRGKLIENSIASLVDLKHLIFGNGWGVVPDLLLENMSSWQYDQLRLGLNLHFHTHNELIEHLVSLGLLGAVTFLIYLYFIFKESEKYSLITKLGWLLFFKINCFWFLWTGTLSIFIVALSIFIIVDKTNVQSFSFFFKPTLIKQIIFSLLFFSAGTLLTFGSYVTFHNTKINPTLNYGYIIDSIKNKNTHNCLQNYYDYHRGGHMLERFLLSYSSYVLLLNDNDDLEEDAFLVLQELQCKANEIIKSGKASSILLSTAMKVDGDYFYKFGGEPQGIDYFQKYYKDWFTKASMASRQLKNRGDLLLPYLSYAVTNNKAKDAIAVCDNKPKGIEAYCDLIRAYELLDNKNNDIDIVTLKKSIYHIQESVKKGVFNELVPRFWWKVDKEDKNFNNFGVKGIPLAPNVIFLISNEEKEKIELILKANMP